MAILSAVFCVDCSLFMLVSDRRGDHMVLPYSMIGLVIDLYVEVMVSFDFPQVVPVRDLRILMVLSALVLVTFECSAKVSFGSKVTPRIFGCFVVGIVHWSIFMSSVVLYSAGSGVKRVDVDLSGLSCRSFCLTHELSWLRYGCRVCCATLTLGWDVSVFMSSA